MSRYIIGVVAFFFFHHIQTFGGTPQWEKGYWESIEYAVVDSVKDQISLQELGELDFKKAKVPNYIAPDHKVLLTKIKLPRTENDVLSIQWPVIESLKLYLLEGTNYVLKDTEGAALPFGERELESSSLAFDLGSIGNTEDGDSISLLLVASSRTPIFLPVSVYSYPEYRKFTETGNFLFGTFLGIMLALILYNLFLFIATGDKSYLPYLAFLIAMALAQAATSGYGYKYIWSFSPYFNTISVPVLSSIAGIAGLLFAKDFLDVTRLKSKVWLWLTNIFILIYILPLILALFGNIYWGFSMLNFPGITAGVFLLILSLYRVRQGFRPAAFYFIAWFIFLVSLMILSLRNLAILPFNDFTTLAIYGGTALEAILLSLALADRINILRMEKEESQKRALDISRENEKIIREQNVMLEQKVDERTHELQETNNSLTKTLSDLREAQSQLVDAEKMASLGQLTAGIAHEINNPINFVTSNVQPLRRDINDIYEIIEAYSKAEGNNGAEALKAAHDLKEELEYDYLREEIDSLVQGIAEGAGRTSEIIRGLKTFSRLDEDVVKLAHLHDNISSTMILLRNKIKNEVRVVNDFDPELPEIECYPGKLNQVFMNILNNAIYAVLHKEYEEGDEPTITLKTEQAGEMVKLHIIDNGIGMDEETQKKMYDPFFTTKEVGEGTGLGMSIVYKIIDKHNGRLDVRSKTGEGTEFIITLPKRQPNEFE